MRVPLSSPPTIAGQTLDAIELRPPGSAVFRVMQSARGPVGFPEAAMIKFAARPSGHSEPTIRRLARDDLAVVARAVEDDLYAQARRRFGVRAAIAETAKVAAKAQREGRRLTDKNVRRGSRNYWPRQRIDLFWRVVA